MSVCFASFPTFSLTRAGDDGVTELDSPDASAGANVSSCVWYLPDQRGCLVYPVRRITLADWYTIPEIAAPVLVPGPQPISDELVQLIVTLEAPERSSDQNPIGVKEQGEEDSVMLSRFGRVLAWRNRRSRSLDLLLETDATRTFQLIVATFGSGRFGLDGGRLKLVQLESKYLTRDYKSCY